MIGRAASEPLLEKFQPRLGPVLDRVAETAADHLRKCGKALVARGKPPPLDKAEDAIDHFTQALAAIRREGLTQDLSVNAVERIFTLGFALEQTRQNHRDLDVCVRQAARR
jgi:hypothetical protein